MYRRCARFALLQKHTSSSMRENTQADDMKERMQSGAHAELGLTKEEFEARKIRAGTPYKVRTKSDKELNIVSSARAQQIMTQGSAEKLVELKNKEVEKKTRQARGFALGMGLVGVVVGTIIIVVALIPVINMHNKRYLMQKRRYEEIFLPSLARLEAKRAAELEEAQRQQQQQQQEQEQAQPLAGAPPQSSLASSQQ